MYMYVRERVGGFGWVIFTSEYLQVGNDRYFEVEK
jgi:hypothetical protein